MILNLKIACFVNKMNEVYANIIHQQRIYQNYQYKLNEKYLIKVQIQASHGFKIYTITSTTRFY